LPPKHHLDAHIIMLLYLEQNYVDFGGVMWWSSWILEKTSRCQVATQTIVNKHCKVPGPNHQTNSRSTVFML